MLLRCLLLIASLGIGLVKQKELYTCLTIRKSQTFVPKPIEGPHRVRCKCSIVSGGSTCGGLVRILPKEKTDVGHRSRRKAKYSSTHDHSNYRPPYFAR